MNLKPPRQVHIWLSLYALLAMGVVWLILPPFLQHGILAGVGLSILGLGLSTVPVAVLWKYRLYYGLFLLIVSIFALWRLPLIYVSLWLLAIGEGNLLLVVRFYPPFARYQKPVGYVFLILGLGCSVLASRFFLTELSYFKQTTTLLYWLYTALLLVPAFAFHPPPAAKPQPDFIPPSVRLRFLPLLGGLFSLWLWGESNTYRLGYVWEFYPEVEFGLLLSGLILLAGAFIPLEKYLWGALRQPHRIVAVIRQPEWGGVLLLTFVALGLRLWDLETSIHTFVDEIHFANGVNQFGEVADPDTRLLMPFQTITSFPRLYPYWQSLSVRLFSPSFSSLRLVSVLMGTLTIPAVYWLAKNLFDSPTGFYAAAILAALPPHLHFSRLGLNNIAEPLFGVLAFGFFAGGMHTRRRGYFVVAGLMLGMTQYFYEGGKLLYPPVMLAWAGIFFMWEDWEWGKWLLTFGLAGCVAFPLYYTLSGEAAALTPRLQHHRLAQADWENRLLSDDPYIYAHFTNTLTVYFSKPDSGWFYSGKTALTLPYLLPVLMVGAISGLWVWRRAAVWLIFIWIAGAAVGNSLLNGSAEYPRYVVVLPVLAVILGWGLRYLSQFIPSRYRWGVMAVLLILITVYQTDYYFNTHIQARFDTLYYVDVFDTLYRASELPPETHVNVIANFGFWDYNAGTFRAFFHMPQPLTFYLPVLYRPTYLKDLPPDVPYAFFIAPKDYQTREIISQCFRLNPPRYSPYTSVDKQLVLYFAPVGSYKTRVCGASSQ